MSNFRNQLIGIFIISILFLQSSCQKASPAKSVSETINGVTVKIDYHAPSVKGRDIWGSLVPYNEVWRTGANEATTFEIDQPVLVNGENLPAGKYALFTIPGESKWEVIFNKNWDQWGNNDYDKAEDQLRITVVPKSENGLTEQMGFEMAKDGTVSFKWEAISWDFEVKAAN
ncbi:DUF2911 domain-containing protein [Flexithrix dorotheae]|uniref:DUF2911 domain-containing protein n=1 Tax=Flexithrix dorotheae TaxID=70993 RepID=UPI000363F326|nr:DUF2911 domain-containing protein [Flexithrix dorotheae]